MSVSIAIAANRLYPEDIARVLDALVEHNIVLYQRRIVTRSPWHLRWVPDQLEVCDQVGCKVATISTLRDAALLELAGEGSCGELAADYAAFLIVVQKAPAKLNLIGVAKDSWHVTATLKGAVYDPQVIGAR